VPLGCMFQEYHHESCKPRVIASVHKYLSPTMPPMPFFNVTMVDVGDGVGGGAGVGGAVGARVSNVFVVDGKVGADVGGLVGGAVGSLVGYGVRAAVGTGVQGAAGGGGGGVLGP